MIHRYHLPYYQQVAVYFWPILFFELWRVDRWTEATGRRVFVEVDRYGRAWAPWWEGMSQHYHTVGVTAQVWSPRDVDALLPGNLGRSQTDPDNPGLSPGIRTLLAETLFAIPARARERRGLEYNLPIPLP